MAADIQNLPNAVESFSRQASVRDILPDAKPLPGPPLGAVVSCFLSCHRKCRPSERTLAPEARFIQTLFWVAIREVTLGYKWQPLRDQSEPFPSAPFRPPGCRGLCVSCQ